MDLVTGSKRQVFMKGKTFKKVRTSDKRHNCTPLYKFRISPIYGSVFVNKGAVCKLISHHHVTPSLLGPISMVALIWMRFMRLRCRFSRLMYIFHARIHLQIILYNGLNNNSFIRRLLVVVGGMRLMLPEGLVDSVCKATRFSTPYRFR
jgi:hypothetical protein